MLAVSTRPRMAASLAMLLTLGALPTSAMAAMHGRDRMVTEAMQPPRGYAPPMRPPEIANRPSGFDRLRYNHNFQAPTRFAVGPYNFPAGQRYRHFRFGEVLPRALWSANYFLSDYWLFGLDMPPIGYEWVRYGPDALLIDTHTGEIAQVTYGTFV